MIGRKLAFIAVAMLFLFGFTHCGVNEGHEQHENGEKEAPTRAVTQWSDDMELFMEYPIPIMNEGEKFIIHLTHLQDFQPVRNGAVKLKFVNESGETFEVRDDTLLREGIFTPIVNLPRIGTYAFSLDYEGPETEETFSLGPLVVHERLEDIPEMQEEGEEGIAFLKEQQWKIDFRTERVQQKPLLDSLKSLGSVIPRRSSYAEVTSPVEGILRVADGSETLVPGKRVKAGEILVTLSQPLNPSNSWMGRKLAYELARKEYARAKRLKENHAISDREFEQIHNHYLIQKASFETQSQSANSGQFQLKAPIAGMIAEVSVMPGQKVEPGQKLLTIVDPARVWLKVDLFEKDYYRMGQPVGVTLTVPGLQTKIPVTGEDYLVLSMGNILEPESRTIPVLLEIANPGDRLKLGQTVQVDLHIGDPKSYLCVPEGAVFDDDGKQVVFVQTEGETFEKRVVDTGPGYQGWTGVLDGLNEGEHVVTRGGYQVKLASSSKAIGHPHAH